MTIDRMVLSTAQNSVPVAVIQPCLEALVSVHLGDDPANVWTFWQHLVHNIQPKTPYVFDNRLELGRLRPAGDEDRIAIRTAFGLACTGPSEKHHIDWATTSFVDTPDTDGLPSYSCTCTIGWVTSPAEPRGFSLRVTVPVGYPWEKLVDIGRELAVQWPRQWHWITIGYRFIPIGWHNKRIEESLNVIYGRSKRFLGVDVGDPLGLYTSFWQDWIRTVHWCTILPSAFLERLGGIQTLLCQLIPPIEAETLLGETIMFRVCEKPSLGDVNRREDTSGYRALDSILRPIRSSGEVNFLGLWDAVSTKEWLERWQD